MDHETRPERWLSRAIARTSTPRGAAVVIATAATTVTVVAGLCMTLLDSSGFPTPGSGLWWAVQTVTTVGYGDSVPTTAAGQLVAALVMLLGIAFLTVITAAITGAFISRSSKDAATGGDGAADQLKAIHQRLERIEATLDRLA